MLAKIYSKGKNGKRNLKYKKKYLTEQHEDTFNCTIFTDIKIVFLQKNL